MRFLADMGVSLRVVEWLRANGHDAEHLSELGLARLPNGEIFERGITEDRVVLTFDLDFSEIAAATQGRTTSVIVFRLRDTTSPNQIGRLEAVLGASSAQLESGAVVSVEDVRHRIRLLPIGE